MSVKAAVYIEVYMSRSSLADEIASSLCW